MGYSENLEEINVIIYTLKLITIIAGTYYCISKNLGNENNTRQPITNLIINIIISIISAIIWKLTNSINSILFLIFSLSIIMSIITKIDIEYCILINTIYLSINYIFFFIAVIISYFPNRIMNIQNNYISLTIISSIYFLLIGIFFRIKRFKNGISFIKEKIANEYFNSITLIISIIVLILVIILSNYKEKIIGDDIIVFIFLTIVMFITIQKLTNQYYKQKLLIQELNETKEELKKKKEEIKELEQENLNFSKTSHTIAHRQKALEYRLNELMLKNEISEETEIARKIENISKEISSKKNTVIVKTTIPEIDNILKYMQAESEKNKIEFQVQISGNLYHMTNNYISKEDLEILLADHIKNAIIAINHSENTNKSILVRIGLIDGIHSLYIYDTGIEFEIETLENLGKKPATTHAEEGGTGIGFINTFETLNKYKASITIREIGKPSKDNYTKVIIIKFDQKNEFKISSYRKEKIKRSDTIIEK